MKNPWIELSETEPYVLPSDLEQVMTFNARRRLSECKRLQLHVVPEPYIGRIDAPIVFLKLNPGFRPDDARFSNDHYAREVWRKNLLHEPLEYPFYPLDPNLTWSSTAMWWRSRLREILELFDDGIVANNVLCIEAFPYHSCDTPGFPGILPSQQYSFTLVEQTIDRGATILMANAVKWWFTQVPRLEGFERLHIARTARGGYLSRGVYPEGFTAMANILRTCR